MKSETRKQPRISLLSLLLLVAVVCLSLSHFRVSQRLSTSQSELRRIRDEVGYLTIDDDTKFHAVAVDSPEPNSWRWRLFVPKGRRYEWNIACDDIVFSTPTPQPIKGVSNQPYWETDNTVLVTARLSDLDDKTCMLSVTSKIGDSELQMAGASLRIPREKLPYSVRIQSDVLGSDGTAILDPSGPIFLLQRREAPPEPEDPMTMEYDNSVPMPGFMIWLSEW